MPLRICRLLSRRRYLRLQHIWLFRHYDPRDQVADETYTSHERSNQPYYPHNGYIYVEILRHAHADTGDFAAFSRTNQALAGNHAADTGSAVSADIGIVLDGLATIVAVHKDLRTIGYARFGEKVPATGLTSAIWILDSLASSFGAVGTGINRDHGLVLLERPISPMQQVVHFTSAQSCPLGCFRIGLRQFTYLFVRRSSGRIVFLTAH